MANFIIRIELHKTEDYNSLHEFMKKSGFRKTITGDDGIEYHMPRGEYSLDSDSMSIKVALIKAGRAANRTGHEFSILISAYEEVIWLNLVPVKMDK